MSGRRYRCGDAVDPEDLRHRSATRRAATVEEVRTGRKVRLGSLRTPAHRSSAGSRGEGRTTRSTGRTCRGVSACASSSSALVLGWLPIPTASASAESCIYSGGNLGSWHGPRTGTAGTCPAPDSAAAPQFTEVTVSADADAGRVFLGRTGKLAHFLRRGDPGRRLAVRRERDPSGEWHRHGRRHVPQGGPPGRGHAVHPRHRRSRAQRGQPDGRRA